MIRSKDLWSWDDPVYDIFKVFISCTLFIGVINRPKSIFYKEKAKKSIFDGQNEVYTFFGVKIRVFQVILPLETCILQRNKKFCIFRSRITPLLILLEKCMLFKGKSKTKNDIHKNFEYVINGIVSGSQIFLPNRKIFFPLWDTAICNVGVWLGHPVLAILGLFWLISVTLMILCAI